MYNIQWHPKSNTDDFPPISIQGGEFELDGELFHIDGITSHQFQTPEWGKKETQVQTVGKHTAIQVDPLESVDNSTSTYAWRYDESFFCIQHQKRLYIYNEDGTLYSKYNHDIADAITWYHHRIITIQRRRKQLMGVVVEKNGLDFQSFPIPADHVVSLSTNEDQNILIMQTNSAHLFWTLSNGEWQCLSTRTHYPTNASPSLSTVQHGPVALSIHHHHVRCIDFRLGIIPPPLFHIQVAHPDPIVYCQYHNDHIYALSNAHLYITPLEKGIQKTTSHQQTVPHNIDIPMLYNQKVDSLEPSDIIQQVFYNERAIVHIDRHVRFGGTQLQGITSMRLFKHFLITTTLDRLHIYNLNTNAAWDRDLEHGAHLVHANHALIFQMPRGNFESFYPRPFLIDLILNSPIVEAISLARKHKIDFNLIFDLHNWQETALLQCPYDHLTLVLHQLTNKPCDQYTSELALLSIKVERDSHKVASVCSFIREHLGTSLEDLQLVMMTHVKEEHLDLVTQLLYVNKDTDLFVPLVQHAIFLLDRTKVYKLSFSTYDLDFIKQCAHYCEVDPQALNALLAPLQSMSTPLMKFHLDTELERYGEAIIHLLPLDVDFKDHLLTYHAYKAPLAYIMQHDPHNQYAPMIWKHYSEYLMNKSKVASAICDYLGGGDQHLDLFLEMKMYSAAYFTCKDTSFMDTLSILNDKQGMFKCMAIHCTQGQGDWDGMVDMTPEKLILKAESIQSALYSKQSVLYMYKERIEECREMIRAKLKALEMEEGYLDDNASVASMESTRSTAFSQMTGLSKVTMKTAKSQKKQKQKAPKKGTIYEEVDLINKYMTICRDWSIEVVEWEEVHALLYMSHLYKEAKALYAKVYATYGVLVDMRKIFGQSLLKEQLEAFGKSTLVSKMDLVAYGMVSPKPDTIVPMPSKPVWLHLK